MELNFNEVLLIRMSLLTRKDHINSLLKIFTVEEVRKQYETELENIDTLLDKIDKFYNIGGTF